MNAIHMMKKHPYTLISAWMTGLTLLISTSVASSPLMLLQGFGSDGHVFVANGSGDGGTLSQNLSEVIRKSNAGFSLETFRWSHGKGRVLIDHFNSDNHKYQGRRLAAAVQAYREVRPGSKVYLIGHSTGCAVVLIAAENLPPASVEKIILLAPSVPDTYDLRPALHTARSGLDTYHSRKDQILGVGIKLIGTTDLESSDAAGLKGFRLVYSHPTDHVLYQKLRQHHWDRVVEWSGHDGNHLGCVTTGYLRAYVLPEMLK
jgi:pimeloyl-ACP methyl ester carboxylesterase